MTKVINGLLTHSDRIILLDRESRLTCHFIPVDGTANNLVESVRDLFIASMNNFGYVGFSREIDNIFHVRSMYVYITEATNIVMTGRVTPRPLGTILPFEMGTKDDGGFYRLNEDESVVDINTYTYVRGYYKRAMPLLTAGLGYCSKLFGARRAYCLYDVSNEKIKRAYMSVGFVLSNRFHEPIHYPSFCRQIQRRLEPVRWRVMEWDNENIVRQARTAVEHYELTSPQKLVANLWTEFSAQC
jgi:hypothetical protein